MSDLAFCLTGFSIVGLLWLGIIVADKRRSRRRKRGVVVEMRPYCVDKERDGWIL